MSLLGRMFGFGRNSNYDTGLRYFDQGLYEQAIECLQKVIDQDDGSDPLSKRLSYFYIGESNSCLGIAAMQKQAYAKAKQHLAAALAINPHYADLRLHFGRACHKLGDIEAARESYREALQINPRFAKARFYLGLTEYELGDLESGVSEMQAAVEVEPAFRKDLFDQGLHAAKSSSHEAAHLLFERVAETDIDDITYHVRLGTDLYRRGMFDNAVEELEKALSLNSTYADVHNHLGIAYNAKGWKDQAVAAFRAALAINPNFVEARSNLALTLEDLGQGESANDEFGKILELDPDNALAREHKQS